MDEARLKAIEEQFGNDALYYTHKVDEFGPAIRELIAALREAWEKVKRLEVQCILAAVQGAKDGDEIAEVYKAEGERLKDDLLHKEAVIKALQQQYVDHMRPLVALREEAERIVTWTDTHQVMVQPLIERLRKALDACTGHSR